MQPRCLPWRKTFITVDVILGVLLVVAEVAVILNYRKKKKEQEA